MFVLTVASNNITATCVMRSLACCATAALITLAFGNEFFECITLTNTHNDCCWRPLCISCWACVISNLTWHRELNLREPQAVRVRMTNTIRCNECVAGEVLFCQTILFIAIKCHLRCNNNNNDECSMWLQREDDGKLSVCTSPVIEYLCACVHTLNWANSF